MPDPASLTVLAAILSLARAPAVDPVTERPRLERLAADVAAVVQARDELAHWLPGTVLPLPLRGAGAREGAALMLVAIISHESGFRAEVEDCRILGSDHPSITGFQLLGRWARGPYSRAQLCAAPRLAAERALAVLAHHGARCTTPARWLAGYASGDCGRDPAAARRQCRLWERLASDAGLLASCSTRTVRRRSPPP